MRVREIMSPTVDSIDASKTIDYAARRMADDDVGILPILSNGELVGIVTDRDIVVRGVASGISLSAPVRRVMTKPVSTCGPEDDVESVLALMSREQIRRMPVCDHNHDVIGIIALADAAKWQSLKAEVGDTLADISGPSGMHCQVPVFA